jgi:hypothetical protein
VAQGRPPFARQWNRGRPREPFFAYFFFAVITALRFAEFPQETDPVENVWRHRTDDYYGTGGRRKHFSDVRSDRIDCDLMCCFRFLRFTNA